MKPPIRFKYRWQNPRAKGKGRGLLMVQLKKPGGRTVWVTHEDAVIYDMIPRTEWSRRRP